MDGIQGAVLGVKLRHLERWTEARRSAAAAYEKTLVPLSIGRPQEPPCARHVYHVYAVRSTDRMAAQAALDAAGIGHGIHYPVPVHLQPAFDGYGKGRGSLPVSEALADEFLSLPMFPGLEAERVGEVVASLACT